MVDELVVGAHTLGYEPETGLVRMVHVGLMNADEMRGIADKIAEYARTYHPGRATFFLVDNRRAAGITSDARRVMSLSPVLQDEMYCALFGASFAVRTVINMVFKAVTIATSSKSVVVALASEDDARAWLTDRKLAYGARVAKSA
ncbi:MAG TPA: hypothetical protein VM580_11440 [Labilithrix sp.]|nr:hypothetical protein [Labilithrix sp.]